MVRSVLLLVLSFTAWGSSADPLATATASTKAQSDANPLLQPWSGPYGGVPAFDRMQLEDIEPALEAAMAEALENIQGIADQTEAPTFENTIAALERADRRLDRVFAYYGIWRSNLSSAKFREIQRKMAPRLSAYQTAVIQNEKLFDRIQAVYQGDDFDKLRADQQRVTQLVHDRFARNGATLEGDAAKRYAAIQRELAELHTRFANNVLHDEESYVLFLEKDQLSGLPQSFVDAAAAAAAERGEEGKYAVLNTRSSMDPFLTYSDERALREKVWRTYYNRGDMGGEHDNNALIAEILALRDERVGLLGYDNYASWRLEDRMAKTPERAMGLMLEVWKPAIARVEQEVADMQALADAEGTEITIEPWDYRYYAEKVRQKRYALDSNAVKQYLQLEKLREAMFFVADELFDFAFKPVPQNSAVPVFHSDVEVYEVRDRKSDQLIGLWYLDAFARQGKRSGAWATTYRSSTTFDGPTTVLSANNSNFIKGRAGEPVLVSWDDAETFFHEFGHALHFLAADVAYPTLHSGVRDYTEFQSQLLERWLLTDPVVEKYLVHVETGEPMPDELIAKLKAAATFNQGFATTEYLATALIDMKLHMLDDPSGIDIDAYERSTLDALGMPDQLVMRHRTPHLSHAFSSEGYSAGYYGYLWADVLTSDAAEAFATAPGGYYDDTMAKRLVDYLFAPRNAIEPAQAYRLFRGRDASIDALLRDRGFPVTERDEAIRSELGF